MKVVNFFKLNGRMVLNKDLIIIFKNVNINQSNIMIKPQCKMKKLLNLNTILVYRIFKELTIRRKGLNWINRGIRKIIRSI